MLRPVTLRDVHFDISCVRKKKPCFFSAVGRTVLFLLYKRYSQIPSCVFFCVDADGETQLVVTCSRLRSATSENANVFAAAVELLLPSPSVCVYRPLLFAFRRLRRCHRNVLSACAACRCTLTHSHTHIRVCIRCVTRRKRMVQGIYVCTNTSV